MSATEPNKALVRRLVEIVNAGRLERLVEVVIEQIVEQGRHWIGPLHES